MSENLRREIDSMIPAIKQRLDDHIDTFQETKKMIIEWQGIHEEWCKSEMSRFDNELKPLKNVFVQMEKPIRWVGWTITSFVTGILVYLGQKLIIVLQKHWVP